MKKALLLFFIIITIFSFVFGKTYKVGTSAGFPPFEYIENGEFVGFDIELIKEIAKEMAFDVEITDMSFDSLISALVSRKIDVIAAGMTITDKRSRVIDFSMPYWTEDQSVSVKSDSDFDITVLFGNHNIGVQTGTTGDIWVEEKLVETKILTGKKRRYDTFLLALIDLERGKIDAVVLDSSVGESFSKTRAIKTVGILKSNEEYGLAVKKGNTELLNLLNEGLKRLTTNGVIDRLVGKYF